MKSLTKKEKQTMLDDFGKVLVKEVRDRALRISMKIVTQETVNSVKLKQYNSLQNLSIQQQNNICDLLSETITDTIYLFLEMFEEYEDQMKLIVMKDGKEYDMINITEKMGGEIVFHENGWIQRFSEIGRFVL